MSKMFSNTSSFKAFISKVWSDICSAISFAIENSQPRYSFKVAGERFDAQSGKTIILYSVSAKRTTLEMSAIDLCNSNDLISSFHPLDVRIICFIAGMEQANSLPETERFNSLQKLKNTLFGSK